MSFTIMYTTIGFILMVIEVSISVIHATPYTKIFLWLLKPTRFPCGIWFEIFCGDLRESGSDVLVSSLHSYSYNLGELVQPHFLYLRSAVSRSSISSSVYRVFSGRRKMALNLVRWSGNGGGGNCRRWLVALCGSSV